MGKLRVLLCVLVPLVCALFGQTTDVSGTVAALIPNASTTFIGNQTGTQRETTPGGDVLKTENRETKFANRDPKMEFPATRGVIACEQSRGY